MRRDTLKHSKVVLALDLVLVFKSPNLLTEVKRLVLLHSPFRHVSCAARFLKFVFKSSVRHWFKIWWFPEVGQP